MENVNQTPATENTAADATNTAATEVKAPKAPSKMSLALAIFNNALELRRNGQFATNKEFRAHVLRTIETDLSVSTASAATMYNTAKKAAEAADTTVVLGRDPKKEKVKVSTGKRGRPLGSKNRPKVVAQPVTETESTETTIVVNEPAEQQTADAMAVPALV